MTPEPEIQISPASATELVRTLLGVAKARPQLTPQDPGRDPGNVLRPSADLADAFG